MKRIKTIVSFLCAAALALTLLVMPSSASGGLFFLSLNDTLPAQSVQMTPVQYSGWVYVPVNVFNSQSTGVNFGLYYGLTENNTKLVLYNLSGKTMTFDLQNGTATAVGGEAPVPGKVLRQNGVYYVPAYAVCRYFGLSYSFYSTDYGPLLRLKDGNAMLSDSLFLSSAASIMRSRINSYYQSQSPNGGGDGGGNSTIVIPNDHDSGTPSQPNQPGNPDTPVAPDIPADAEPAPTFSLYVGVQASADREITATLNAMSTVGVRGVVFFPAEEVNQCADQIRQAAGRGHKVGLIPTGNTPAQRLESVEAGSRQLAGILRQETWFVLSKESTLAEAGYLCWTPGLTFSSVTDPTRTYETLVRAGEQQGSALRVLVHSQSAGGALAGVLGQLAQDGDTFLPARETSY